MTQLTTHIGRTARRSITLVIPLLIGSAGVASAHGSGSYGGGMMGGGWGLFGSTMGLWGFLWMGLLLLIPVALLYTIVNRQGDDPDDRPLSVLRERYARGEVSDEEFETRRARLDRSD